MLLEREGPLELLTVALEGARRGCGHSVFIGGEAGIGKTSLVESFLRSSDGAARVLWGACEALATPRPLGPLYDMAQAAGGKVVEALAAGAAPHRLFHAFVEDLREAGCATIVVIEDAHWADDASADFIKFLARRVARCPTVLAVTFREEELIAGHPLSRAVTDVPPDHVSRVRLTGLSAAAVDRLADAHGRTIPNLHALTDGNPFLATELLRSRDGESPASLRDAMTARLHRLPPTGLEVAELVSVIPDRVDRLLLDRAFPGSEVALQHCIDHRILVAEREHVRYRHELARRVVEECLPEPRRRALHARVLGALARDAADARLLSRLVHHADAAGDAASVLRYAPLAAEECARRGAHRQAASFCRTAVRHADRAARRERAQLLDRLAAECGLSGGGEEALSANARAFGIWHGEGDTFAQGSNRRARFDLLHTGLFRRGGAEFVALAEETVSLLEPYGASAELARACMNLAVVRTMNGSLAEAQRLHERAVDIAEAVGDNVALSHILLQGEQRKHMFFGEPRLEPAERALRLALECGDDPAAAHAHFCLAMFAANSWQFDAVERFVAAGLRFAEERDLDGQKLHLRGMRARAALVRGDWRTAESLAAEVLAHAELPGIAEFNASMVLGLSQARRGDSRAGAILEHALELSTTRIVARISKVLALVRLVELRWLEGDASSAADLARRAVDEAALMGGHPWISGLAVFWRWRIDGGKVDTARLAVPYAMQLDGDWAGAAAAWAALGSPCERAMALVDGDDPARREAFAILDRIGATATARRCREVLAARGVTGIPRGPRPSTRANPMGLTVRELEVLALLEEGLRNAEIGERLHRSDKTVARHVAAILDKLGAATRHEAVRIARACGLTGQTR